MVEQSQRISVRSLAMARAVEQLWRRGLACEGLLDSGQRAWVRRFLDGDGNAVWCIGRQRGKSFAALTMACEFANKYPKSIIRYAAKTKESAEKIVQDTLTQVLADCPVDLRPKEDTASLAWPNGSIFTWAGTDAQSFDRLRGPRANLILFDESGFYQDLERVEAALLPQLTTTGGKALYLSTPPESLGHPFVRRYNAMLAAGRTEHETIDQNPRLTAEQRKHILRSFAELNGMSDEDAEKSTFWRREYLAQFVQEESRAAIPSFTQEKAAQIVMQFERPEFYDAYVSVDFGWGDGHGALFAAFDFVNQKLLIEDFFHVRGKTLAEFQAMVKERETKLWGVTRFEGSLYGAKEFAQHLPDFLKDAIRENAPRQPFVRVGDDQMLLLAELRSHGLAIIPTKKDEKHLAVDAVTQAVARGEILIHPRAAALVHHLHTTTWNNQRTQWERTGDHHGEGVDTLVYMYRNLRKHRDPRPIAPVDPWLKHTEPAPSSALAAVFGVRKR